MPKQSARAKRPISPALEKILGKPLKVLDDGFVRVVDYMGNDSSIVQAARVSYGAGTKKVTEDRGLLRYLMRHQHQTPFEMCEIKLHVRVPMDCWRQWIRHRTANVNEYSTRYSVAIDRCQVTKPSEWRLQSQTNRQGSEAPLPAEVGRRLSDRERALQELSREVYEERLQHGVAREQARKDLPLSTYTEAYWKIDLRNLLHFLKLRMEIHAQQEIREYAHVIGHKVVGAWCPLTWEAFHDYEYESLQLSKRELDTLSAVTHRNPAEALKLAVEAGWLDADKKPSKANRERSEFEAKLAWLGLSRPW